ncbi:hypothetical protein [Bartonella sp. LJL80]
MFNRFKFFACLILSLSIGATLCLADESKEQNLSLDSIDSLEGNNLQCSATMDGELRLDISRETGRTAYILKKQDQWLHLTRTDISYSRVFDTPQKNGDSDALEIFSKSSDSYYKQGKPVCPFCEEPDLQAAQTNFNFLKKAIHEAHQKDACKGWTL